MNLNLFLFVLALLGTIFFILNSNSFSPRLAVFVDRAARNGQLTLNVCAYSRHSNDSGELDMRANKNDFEIEAADDPDDPDEYDDAGEANDPNSPIWEDSAVQDSSYGNDPSSPDSDEISQD